MSGTAKNTDRELWRKVKDNYYSPSLHVTVTGGIGINKGGTVYVKPIEEWHRLAEAEDKRMRQREMINKINMSFSDFVKEHCSREVQEMLEDTPAERKLQENILKQLLDGFELKLKELGEEQR